MSDATEEERALPHHRLAAVRSSDAVVELIRCTSPSALPDEDRQPRELAGVRGRAS